MDGTGRQGTLCAQSNDVPCTGGTTPGLVEGISCVRGRIRYCNRQCSYAAHRTKVVLTGLLCHSEALPGRTELFNNGKGSLGNDIQCNEVPSLLVGTEILIPCGSFGIIVLGLQGIVDRQTNTMEVASTGVRIQDLPQTGSTTCGIGLLQLVRIRRGSDDVKNDLPDMQLFRVTSENTVDGTVAEEDK